MYCRVFAKEPEPRSRDTAPIAWRVYPRLSPRQTRGDSPRRLHPVYRKNKRPVGHYRILVLDQGRIVEQGDHEQLLRLGGHYARLHRYQNAPGLPASLARKNSRWLTGPVSPKGPLRECHGRLKLV